MNEDDRMLRAALVVDADSFDDDPGPERRGRILRGLAHPDQRIRDVAMDAAVNCMCDGVVRDLAALVADPEASEAARCAAAVALGPTLEMANEEGYHDPLGEPPISKRAFEQARSTLRKVYLDPEAPKLVRRRAIEGSARAPAPWHAGAARAAWKSGDSEWKQTAVFAGGYIHELAELVLEGLTDSDPEVEREAVRAAGTAHIEEAGLTVMRLARSSPDRDVRLAAIEALPTLNVEGAFDLLDALSRERDPDVAQRAAEALDELLMWDRARQDAGRDDFDW